MLSASGSLSSDVEVKALPTPSDVEVPALPTSSDAALAAKTFLSLFAHQSHSVSNHSGLELELTRFRHPYDDDLRFDPARLQPRHSFLEAHPRLLRLYIVFFHRLWSLLLSFCMQIQKLYSFPVLIVSFLAFKFSGLVLHLVRFARPNSVLETFDFLPPQPPSRGHVPVARARFGFMNTYVPVFIAVVLSFLGSLHAFQNIRSLWSILFFSHIALSYFPPYMRTILSLLPHTWETSPQIAGDLTGNVRLNDGTDFLSYHQIRCNTSPAYMWLTPATYALQFVSQHWSPVIALSFWTSLLYPTWHFTIAVLYFYFSCLALYFFAFPTLMLMFDRGGTVLGSNNLLMLDYSNPDRPPCSWYEIPMSNPSYSAWRLLLLYSGSKRTHVPQGIRGYFIRRFITFWFWNPLHNWYIHWRVRNFLSEYRNRTLPPEVEVGLEILAQLYIGYRGLSDPLLLASWCTTFIGRFHLIDRFASALRLSASQLSKPPAQDFQVKAYLYSPVHEPQFLGSIVSILPLGLGVVSTVLGATAPSFSDIRPNPILRAIAQSKIDATTVWDAIGPGLREAINSVHAWWTKTPENPNPQPWIPSLYDPLHARMKTWAVTASAILEKPEAIGQDFNTALRTKALMQQYASINAESVAIQMPALYTGPFRSVYHQLAAHESSYRALLGSGRKLRPLVVIIVGRPGTGKTELAPVLLALFSRITRGTPYADHEVWAPDFSQGFANGFNSAKRAIEWNEIGSSKHQTVALAEGRFFLRFCDRSAQLMNKAGVADKEDTYMRAEILVGTAMMTMSEVASVYAVASSSPDAILRRPDFVVMPTRRRADLTARDYMYEDLMLIPASTVQEVEANTLELYEKAAQPISLPQLLRLMVARHLEYAEHPDVNSIADKVIDPLEVAKLESEFPLAARKHVPQVLAIPWALKYGIDLQDVLSIAVVPVYCKSDRYGFLSTAELLLRETDVHSAHLWRVMNVIRINSRRALLEAQWPEFWAAFPSTSFALTSSEEHPKASQIEAFCVDHPEGFVATCKAFTKGTINITPPGPVPSPALAVEALGPLREKDVFFTHPIAPTHFQPRLEVTTVGTVLSGVAGLVISGITIYGVYRLCRALFDRTHDSQYSEKSQAVALKPIPGGIRLVKRDGKMVEPKPVKIVHDAQVTTQVFDDPNLAQVMMAVRANVSSISSEAGAAYCLFISDNNLLMNAHVFDILHKANKPITFASARTFTIPARSLELILICRPLAEKFKLMDFAQNIFESELPVDYVLARCPSNTDAFRNILSHLSSPSDWPHALTSPLVMEDEPFLPVDPLNPFGFDKTLDHAEGCSSPTILAHPHVDTRISVRNQGVEADYGPALIYGVPGAAGFCGKPGYVATRRCTRKVITVHMGGDRSTRSVALLDGDLIRAIIKPKMPAAVMLPLAHPAQNLSVHGTRVVHDAQVFSFPPHVRINGILPQDHWGSVRGNTKLMRTEFCPPRCPEHSSPHICAASDCKSDVPLVAPSLKRPFTLKGVLQDPLLNLLNRDPPPSPTVFELAGLPILQFIRTHVLTPAFLDWYFKPPTSVESTIDVLGVINGSKLHPDVSPLEKDTSLGTFWKNYSHPDACGTRKKWRVLTCLSHGAECSRDDSCRYTLIPPAMDAVRTMLIESETSIPRTIYNFFPKDEPLVCPKLRPRPIFGSQLPYQIAVKMTTGPLFSGIHRQATAGPSIVGLNCLSTDADVVMRRARVAGKSAVGDHVGWDWSVFQLLHRSATTACSRRAKQLYRDRLLARMIRNLLRASSDPELAWEQVSILLARILASGNPVCTDYNTLAHSIKIVTSWMADRISSGRSFSVEEFIEELDVLLYGDDFNYWPTPDHDTTFSCDVYAYWSEAIFGMRISAADKKGPPPPWTPFASLELLKRHPVDSPIGIRLALDEVSIARPLLWTRDNSPLGMCSVFNTTLIEISQFHDQPRYDLLRDFFTEWCLERNVHICFPTFQEQCERWKKRLPILYFSHVHEFQASTDLPTSAPAPQIDGAPMQTIALAAESATAAPPGGSPGAGTWWDLVQDKFSPHIFRLPPDIAKRWNRIQNISWSTGSAANADLFTVLEPYDSLNQPILVNHIENFRYVHCEAIEYQVRATNTAFHAGGAFFWSQPNFDGDARFTALSAKLHMCVARLKASQSMNVEFIIKVIFPHPWLEVGLLNTYHGAFHRLVLTVLNALIVTSANGSTALPLSLYSRFVNLELHGPDAASSLPMSIRSKFFLQRARLTDPSARKEDRTPERKDRPVHSFQAAVAKEKKAKGPPHSANPTAEAILASTTPPTPNPRLTDQIPVIGTVADFALDATSGVANIASGLITRIMPGIAPIAGVAGTVATKFLDKPAHVAPPVVTQRADTRDLTHAEGTLVATPISLAQTPLTAMKLGYHPHVYAIVQRPNFLATVTFNASTAADTLVLAFNGDPLGMANMARSGVGPYTYTSNANWLYYYGRMCALWDLQFLKTMLDIECTSLTSGALVVIALPPEAVNPTSPGAQASELFSYVCEFSGSREEYIKVPKLNSLARMPFPAINTSSQTASSQMCSVLIYLIRAVTVPDTTTTSTVYLNVFTAPDESIRLWHYFGQGGQADGAAPFGLKESQPKSPPSLQELMERSPALKAQVEEVRSRPVHTFQASFNELFQTKEFKPIGDCVRGTLCEDVGAVVEPMFLTAWLRRPVLFSANPVAAVSCDVQSATNFNRFINPFLGWSGSLIWTVDTTDVYTMAPTQAASNTDAFWSAGGQVVRGSLQPITSFQVAFNRRWFYDAVDGANNIWKYPTPLTTPFMYYGSASYSTNSFIRLSVGEDFALIHPDRKSVV